MIDPYDLGTGATPYPPPPRPPIPAPRPAPAPSRWDQARAVAWNVLFAAALAMLAFNLYRTVRPAPGPGPAPPTPTPISDYDPAFVPIGERYARQVARDWARSNEAIARIYNGGQGRKMANDAGAEQFKNDRMKSYREIVVPELEKIVPSGKAEDQVTIEERARLSRAHLGLQKGGETP